MQTLVASRNGGLVAELEYDLKSDDHVAFNLHHYGSTDAGRGSA